MQLLICWFYWPRKEVGLYIIINIIIIIYVILCMGGIVLLYYHILLCLTSYTNHCKILNNSVEPCLSSVAMNILQIKKHRVDLGEECCITLEARPVQLMVPSLVEVRKRLNKPTLLEIKHSVNFLLVICQRLSLSCRSTLRFVLSAY